MSSVEPVKEVPVSRNLMLILMDTLLMKTHEWLLNSKSDVCTACSFQETLRMKMSF